MKTFRATFQKQIKVLGPNQAVQMFAEQNIHTDKDKIDIPVPYGYQLVAVIETLPDITIKSNEKEISKN